jgi:hypothetical protein
MMQQFDYQATRMTIAERHHAADQRRMVREARLAAKAARRQRSGSGGSWRGALVALFRVRPWKHASNKVAKSQLVTEAR